MNDQAAIRNTCRGFNLLEVVMVLACGTILIAIAVPNLSRLQQEWALWGATHALASALRWGRTHAITANSSTMFTVNEGGKVFYWVDPESGARFEGTVRHLTGQVRIVGSPKRSLRFYPRGNAAPAGTYILQGEAGSYRVVVSPAGRIRLQRD
jgi:prepilin-type N-terminal cleavage/methylation domain-containing protein